MTPPFLSIIIPAHNEEVRLPRSVGQVFKFLQQQDFTSEVLIVENGSTDRTRLVARDLAHQFTGLQLLEEELPGKGRAVRLGMLAAHGDFRFIADADLSMPIEHVTRFLPPASHTDITIASREAPGAVRYAEPYFRHLTGRIYNLMIRSLVLPDLQDTQCGFKCFNARAANDICRLQSLSGWSFDVELLVIARHRGYSIGEIGIPWYFDRGSKVRVFRHSWRMVLDLLTIRRNLQQGVYDA